MSTKIYDAFRYTGRLHLSLEEVLGISHQIRDVLFKAGRRLLFQRAAKQLAEFVDRKAAGVLRPGEIKPGESYSRAVTRVFEDATDEVDRGIRSPGWDFTAEWSFAMVDGKLLLRLFAEQEIIQAFARAFPRFRDYHFQTSTERPKEISAREWRQRRLDWDKALGHRTPCETCLSMRSWGKYSGPDPRNVDHIRPFLPSFEDRVYSLAVTIEADAYFSRRWKASKDDEWSRAGRILRAWADARKTAPVQARIAKRAAALARVLPTRITRCLALTVAVPPEPPKSARRKRGKRAKR